MQVANNTVVSFHYKVATAEGEHVDNSNEGEPLVSLIGHGQIVIGLEKALIGKQAGDKLSVTVPPADAYGEADPALDAVVNRNEFPPEVRKKLQPGMQFRAEHPERADQHVLFTIHGVEGDQVFISGNHELAGETLQFEVEIVSVRAGTADEVSHGHAHGAGGHHHH